MQSDFENFLKYGKSDMANLKYKKLIDLYEMETAVLLPFHFSYQIAQRYLLSPNANQSIFCNADYIESIILNFYISTLYSKSAIQKIQF